MNSRLLSLLKEIKGFKVDSNIIDLLIRSSIVDNEGIILNDKYNSIGKKAQFFLSYDNAYIEKVVNLYRLRIGDKSVYLDNHNKFASNLYNNFRPSIRDLKRLDIDQQILLKLIVNLYEFAEYYDSLYMCKALEDDLEYHIDHYYYFNYNRVYGNDYGKRYLNSESCIEDSYYKSRRLARINDNIQSYGFNYAKSFLSNQDLTIFKSALTIEYRSMLRSIAKSKTEKVNPKIESEVNSAINKELDHIIETIINEIEK